MPCFVCERTKACEIERRMERDMEMGIEKKLRQRSELATKLATGAGTSRTRKANLKDKNLFRPGRKLFS